ncbi:hypothetical protein GCM10020219_055530 [Nonomuraea dietziae]
MDFRDEAQLDSSQVEQRGGRGLPGGGLAIGGGITGIIALIAAVIFGVNPGNITGGDPAGLQPTSNLSEQCRTGADADQSEECRVVGVVNSIQEYWGNTDGYQQAKTILFTQAVNTGCGAADSSVGPFYCPSDRQVYLDLTFFDTLQRDFGAKGGPFAQGLRHRPRVRSPRPEPDRPDGARGPGPPGSRQRRGEAGAAGRLLRRGLGQARRGHRVLREGVHPG